MTTLLTPEQLAKLLQCSTSTVWKAVAAGRIPHVRISDRVVRFHPDVVERWAQGATTSEDQ